MPIGITYGPISEAMRMAEKAGQGDLYWRRRQAAMEERQMSGMEMQRAMAVKQVQQEQNRRQQQDQQARLESEARQEAGFRREDLAERQFGFDQQKAAASEQYRTDMQARLQQEGSQRESRLGAESQRRQQSINISAHFKQVEALNDTIKTADRAIKENKDKYTGELNAEGRKLVESRQEAVDVRDAMMKKGPRAAIQELEAALGVDLFDEDMPPMAEPQAATLADMDAVNEQTGESNMDMLIASVVQTGQLSPGVLGRGGTDDVEKAATVLASVFNKATGGTARLPVGVLKAMVKRAYRTISPGTAPTMDDKMLDVILSNVIEEM